MTAAIDVRPDHRQIVEDILRDHLPDRVKVWVFGSRAEWTTKDSSDLDLALEGDGPLDARTVTALELAFEESLLPFGVDVVDMLRIDDGFREAINRSRVVLMERRTTDRLAVSDDFGQHELELRCVAQIVMGQSPPGSTYNEYGIGLPFFQGVKDFTYRKPAPRVFCSAPTRVARKGDILLSVRAPIGRVNVADRECAIGRGLSIIRAKRCSDARYLEFVLRNLAQSWRAVEGSGSVFGNATRRDLETLHVPWPAGSERRAIANVLGGLDDRIELSRGMNETLEAMARTLFKSWFVDFDPVRAKMDGRDTGLPPEIADLFPDRLVYSELGQIPEGWNTTTLGDLCEPPQYGFTASASNDPVGPRFLRITDINKCFWIAWEDVPYCAISSSDLVKYRLRRGDILIARMADPGHGVLVEDDELAVFASYLIRFRPLKPVFARFLQYWLRSRGYWEVVSGRFSGTTRMNINARQLRSLPLVVPSDDAVETFASQINVLRRSVVSGAKETSCLSRVRDTVLSKLISGEIRLPATVIKRYGETAAPVAS